MNHELAQLHADFCKFLAGRYDMPQLTGIPVALHDQPEEIKSTWDLTPSGQMALLIRTLRVVVRVGGIRRAANVVTATAQVEMLYDHHTRGSNGHNEDFVLVGEMQFRYGEETLALHEVVRRDTFHTIKALGAIEYRTANEK